MWTQRESDVFSLALTLWREARGESQSVWEAVAWAVRHRVEAAWDHRNTYQDVCCEPWQFSSLTAPGDPNLVKWPQSSDSIWLQCLDVADGVIPLGLISDPVPHAVFYHDSRLPGAPAVWGSVSLVASIGHLSFYKRA